LYDVPITGEEHSLAKIAQVAFEKGIDPSGMSYQELEDALYPKHLEVVVVETAPEPTPARDLLAELLGADTAEGVSEADAIEALKIASKSGLIKLPRLADRIDEYLFDLLLAEETPAPWPTEPRVGVLVNGADIAIHPCWDDPIISIVIKAGGDNAFWDTKVDTTYEPYVPVIEVKRPFDAIAAPEKEVPQVFTCAGTKKDGSPCKARVKAEGEFCHYHTPAVEKVRATIAAAQEKVKKSIFDGLYRDEKGYYHAGSGHSFRLTHAENGIVQFFNTIKAVAAYLNGGWKIELDNAEASVLS
jgi:hypothetical protein